MHVLVYFFLILRFGCVVASRCLAHDFSTRQLSYVLLLLQFSAVYKMGKVKTSELQTKSIKDLQAQVAELKQELSTLRVAQVTNGAANKLSKISVVRKNVARVLTVLNQKARDKMRKQVEGKKHIPKQLREKKTRAIRRRLTAKQVRHLLAWRAFSASASDLADASTS